MKPVAFILMEISGLAKPLSLVMSDPKYRNGFLFQKFLKENPHLTVLNSLPICDVLITRKRVTVKKCEESILDFFIVCSRILPFVSRMKIDEEKKYILTNYKPAQRGSKAIDTDHFTQYVDLKLIIKNEKQERKYFYNYKNKAGQDKFKLMTSKPGTFSNCFKLELPIDKQIETWKRKLDSCINKSFPKIRIKNNLKPKINVHISSLINKRNSLLLRAQKSEDVKQQIQELEENIYRIQSEEKWIQIKNDFHPFLITQIK